MSENTMTVSTPHEVSVMNPVTPTVPDISTDPMDFQKELQKIAKEQGVEIKDGKAVQTGAPVIDQTKPQAAPQPAQQAVAQPEAEVPVKFQAPDGSPDAGKIEKSTLAAQEALRRYESLEAELRRKQNEVLKLRQAAETPAPVPGSVQPNPLTPEAINARLEQTKNPGQVLLELNQMAYQAALNDARVQFEQEVLSLRQRQESSQRERELEKIAERDPWVYSEEGIKRLGDVRAQNPWLNQAPEPWMAAYQYLKGQAELQKPFNANQHGAPNPTPTAVRPPATPASGAVSRTQAAVPSLAALSQNQGQLNAFLNSLSKEQQAAFWDQALRGV